ncbi:MAG: type III pantothenate kinase [Prevotellaceae bacterium]|nr:type III pantothenate kinase [Prevotellaceae bacterium]
MNLIVDIGNSAVKLAVVEKDRVVEALTDSSASFAEGANFLRKYKNLPTIVASVRSENDEVEKLVNSLIINELRLNHKTPLPIKNLYATPETLGKDRLAAAVGAAHLFPNKNVLVVDAGTALTYELINERGEYLGGNISLGIDMRFRALHEFTGRLPLCRRAEDYAAVGTDTQSAIVAGVLNGALYEVEANIELFSLKNPNLNVILTGGDANFFANRLKKPIFVVYDLVIMGLNRILEHVQQR